MSNMTDEANRSLGSDGAQLVTIPLGLSFASRRRGHEMRRLVTGWRPLQGHSGLSILVGGQDTRRLVGLVGLAPAWVTPPVTSPARLPAVDPGGPN